MSSQVLTTYLNDHLAGSVAALEMLDRLIEHASMADVRGALTRVRAEIAADQQTLERLLAQVGGEQSALRQVGGWIADKVGHLKLLVDDPLRETLQRLEALEMLALGILGKLSLWRALSIAQPQISRLNGIDFGRLAARANEQYAEVEALRLESARRILTDAD